VERDVTPPVAGHERAVVSRGQNTILTLPHDATAIRHFLTLLFERLEPVDEPAIRGVVLAADVEAVMAIGRVAATIDRPPEATLLAVPSAQRGARALRGAAPSILVATPGDLLALLGESLAKLQAVRAVVFAWAEDLLAFEDAPLATVIAELPKDAARILVTARLTPTVESFAERYVRRIARGAATVSDAPRIPLSYVTVADSAKPSSLRRVLDTLDPASATVYARTEEGARAAHAELAGMGSAATGVQVITDAAPIETSLLVLFELPTSGAELRTLASGSVQQVVALARGREMPLLRSLTAASPRPLALGGPADRARAREAASREALRAVLADGVPPRELLALEPLLEEYDGLEIAAAALKLLDRARESGTAQPVATAPAPAAATTSAGTAAAPRSPTARGPVRVFINAGTRDGATARDFVGAIANVATIPVDRIGKVEVRDSHALVELQGPDADLVVEKLAGATIRGRRVTPRLDREPATGDRRGERPRERSGGPPKRSAGPRDRMTGSRERSGGSRDRTTGSRERSSGPRERTAGPRERSGGTRERSGSVRDGGGDRARERGAPPRRDRSTAPRGRRPT
jgi:ATP-dependent RNA helicase DeaD